MPHTETTTSTEPTRFQCRHILAAGHQCGSVSLRHEQFCYFHHTSRVPIRNPRERHARRSTFELPLIEDRASIQAALGEILQRIVANELDNKRASLLLYGLQIASSNLPKLAAPDPKTRPIPTVEEVIEDPELGQIGPQTEYNEDPYNQREKSLEQILTEQWEKDKHLYHHDRDPEPKPKGTQIPQIQAVAETPNLKRGSVKPAVVAKRCATYFTGSRTYTRLAPDRGKPSSPVLRISALTSPRTRPTPQCTAIFATALYSYFTKS